MAANPRPAPRATQRSILKLVNRVASHTRVYLEIAFVADQSLGFAPSPT
jgi:hypothetical protein